MQILRRESVSNPERRQKSHVRRELEGTAVDMDGNRRQPMATRGRLANPTVHSQRAPSSMVAAASRSGPPAAAAAARREGAGQRPVDVIGECRSGWHHGVGFSELQSCAAMTVVDSWFHPRRRARVRAQLELRKRAAPLVRHRRLATDGGLLRPHRRHPLFVIILGFASATAATSSISPPKSHGRPPPPPTPSVVAATASFSSPFCPPPSTPLMSGARHPTRACNSTITSVGRRSRSARGGARGKSARPLEGHGRAGWRLREHGHHDNEPSSSHTDSPRRHRFNSRKMFGSPPRGR